MKDMEKETQSTETAGKLIAELSDNPHFSTLPDILAREGIDRSIFMISMRYRLECFVSEHTGDNEELKEESYHYILPAIAVYKALQTHTEAALVLFREMWLNGAKLGAEYLRQKAQNESFLRNWIPSVTPKKTETGAFLFRIDHVTDHETEYHVLRCPYVQFCHDYGCPEIITVFCDSDDLSFGKIHPRLLWGRTKTIGRGDPYCNFKYTLLEEAHEEAYS